MILSCQETVNIMEAIIVMVLRLCILRLTNVV